MHKNKIWLTFLGAFTLLLLWYTADAAFKLWKYESLTTSTDALTINFSIKEDSYDRFLLIGNYTFGVDNKKYEASSLLQTPVFRNLISAKESVNEYPKKKWRVWFNPLNPSYSSLQKSYPFKEVLYTTILWGLFFYFLWLGWRVKTKAF